MFIDGKMNILKIFLPNFRFNVIPVKIPAGCFVDINKLILKFIWKSKRLSVANTILRNKVGALTVPDFKTTLRVQ